MKTKIISGQKVTKNPQHKGMWDIIGSGGRHEGRPSFTGSMAEVRAAIKFGDELCRKRGLK
jgi:hypothetical protein